MPVSINREKGICSLSEGNVSYVLYTDRDGRLMNLYWGKRLDGSAIIPHMEDYTPAASFDGISAWLPWEVPVLGRGWYGTPALEIESGAGDHVTDLRVKDIRSFAGKRQLQGLPAVYAEEDSEADSLEIDLEDAFSSLLVTVTYSIFREGGALTRSMRITNCGKQTLMIRNAQAASVPLWGNDFDVIHLKGAWARERTVTRTPLGEAETMIESQRGASGHEENPFLALCEKTCTEREGSVWAMNLIYSGSFRASARVDNAGNARLSMGLNPQVFSWQLRGGETFQTPEAVLVYSDRGLNGMSAVFHRLYRTRLARGTWRDRERPILINNWEATYFDFTEEKLLSIAREAANLGFELFVMDDGWFGRRNNDHCSLGDWKVNREKLPGGLRGLSDKIHALGLMFGIWVEPEMVSPDSDLYRAHEDWCLHAGNRPRTEARNQLILDMGRREVQDYIIDAISDVLREANADYVKWDMNRNMTEYFSEALPPERQKEAQHRYMLGLYRVLEEITGAFPGVLFESCSGGGGRFDGGMLYYMPQTWTSDNTDAVCRLSIQYGTSLVYPASAMGAHVSAVPNHQCHRSTSLKTRGDVALSGNFGFELDLTKLTEEERSEAREMIRRVKAWRHLTAKGIFSRLDSPENGSYAAWQFVSEDGKEALLCTFRILASPNRPAKRFRMVGLEPDAVYREQSGEKYTGAQLMYMGISTCQAGDFSSSVKHFLREA